MVPPRNNGKNIASQMQIRVAPTQQLAPKEAQQTCTKVDLAVMQEELLSLRIFLPFHVPWQQKQETPEQRRYAPNRDQVLCGEHFPYPTSRKGTIATYAANASLTRTSQNPPHQPTRSNMLHLQPHKKSTLQP